MPKCSQCGTENAEGTPLCRQCGVVLPLPSADGSEADGAEADGAGSSADEAQLLALMRDGQKIEAIKIYRERYHVGLKEAKDAVEALAAGHGIAARGGGCAGVVLLGLLAGAWYLLA